MVDDHEHGLILNESGTSVSFGWDAGESEENKEDSTQQEDKEDDKPKPSGDTDCCFRWASTSCSSPRRAQSRRITTRWCGRSNGCVESIFRSSRGAVVGRDRRLSTAGLAGARCTGRAMPVPSQLFHVRSGERAAFRSVARQLARAQAGRTLQSVPPRRIRSAHSAGFGGPEDCRWINAFF